MTTPSSNSRRSPLVLSALLLAAAPFSTAQTAPVPATDATTLARYDTDRNGRIDASEQAAIDADQRASAAATASSADANDDIVALSPFEVVTDNRGYYASNTMSGTRFNAKLDDLASSITVMTKEQMSDFAMLDVNDIFLYTANTEGTGTYTDYTLDRNGSISDNVQINPTQANRVRGIAPANMALGNVETMGRVPVDPSTIEAVEVSRGPNANVFGLGNPSGTVNQVPAAANLTRNRSQLELRADSFRGYRGYLDVNRMLIENKLAIRASAVFQHEGFDRRPSGVDTERYNGMIKYRPFKNTTITGALYYYYAEGNRPNAIPPRDNLSYWIASGRPTWDPVTQQIHIDGQTVRTVTAANYNGPDYFTVGYLGNDRGQLFIDQGRVAYWAAPRGTTSTVGPNLATLQAGRYLQPTAAAGAVFSGTAPRPFDQPLFNTTSTISDRSIYDWSSINLSAPNRFWDKSLTSLIQLDQILLDTPTQKLAVQGLFMREDSDRWARNLLGISNDNGQSGQLTVDVNERHLDGTPNPFFLRPYISSDKPRTTFQPAQWDTTRAQLAYSLDLSRRNDALKWLGSFQVTGYSEYKYRINRQYSYRDAIGSDISWIPAGTYRGTQSAPSGFPAVINLTQSLNRFYVGDAVGNNVDYAPSDFDYGTFPFVWGNVATGAFRSDQLSLEQVAADKSGGTFNTKNVLKTNGGVIQSHLFGDRLVTTYGVRRDKTFLKFGHPGTPTNNFLNADGKTFNYDVIDSWTPTYFTNGGRTTNLQFVVRPFMNTALTSGKDGSGSGELFAEILDGLSITYNESESFLPLSPAQDLFKNILPNPTGTDESWGLGLNLFDGKLVVRATRYDNFQRDAQTNDMSTMAGRVLRVDFPVTGAGNPTPFLNLRTNALRWVATTNPSWTPDQVQAEVARITGFDGDEADYYQTVVPPIGATADIRSKGTEIELNYNPTTYWTLAASATDTKSTNVNVSKSLVDWIDTRREIWESIVDPTITDANAAAENNPGKLWWLHRYSAISAVGAPASFSATAATPQSNFIAFVDAPFGVIRAQEGKNNPQVRRYGFRASTRFDLAGVTEHRWLRNMTVGGAIRWEDKGAIGYFGLQSLPASITELDPNRPIYDKSHYYVDAFVSYRTKLWNDKLGATFKLNVRNLGENGRLQPVGAFPNGDIHTFRIVDPQQFILTASFDL